MLKNWVEKKFNILPCRESTTVSEYYTYKHYKNCTSVIAHRK